MVRLPVHPEARHAILEPSTTPLTGEVAGEVTGEVGLLIRNVTGDMKRTELQAALGLRHEDHFRKSYLIPAVVAGLLEMTVPGKPRSRRQRYRLTEKGRAWLAADTAPPRIPGRA